MKKIEKRPGLRKNHFSPAQKGVLAIGKLGNLRYGLLGHPPYSPDLADSEKLFFYKAKGDCSCRGKPSRSYGEPLQHRDNGVKNC